MAMLQGRAGSEVFRQSDVEAQVHRPEITEVLAESTDKVDASVYIVPEPDYPTRTIGRTRFSWRTTTATDGSPLHREVLPTSSMGLKNGRYNAVQTDDPNTLDNISDNGMQAMGVLYTDRMRTWFEEVETNHPNDSRVMFWGLLDEPDAGPGSKVVGERGSSHAGNAAQGHLRWPVRLQGLYLDKAVLPEPDAHHFPGGVRKGL